MNRRAWLKKSLLTTTGAIAAPYLGFSNRNYTCSFAKMGIFVESLNSYKFFGTSISSMFSCHSQKGR